MDHKAWIFTEGLNVKKSNEIILKLFHFVLNVVPIKVSLNPMQRALFNCNRLGFQKKNKSTATAGALLQSIISRAADNHCYVVMASLDLSMAFDLVNTELLIKRLKSWECPMMTYG